MRDISNKTNTLRIAVAKATVKMSSSIIEKVKNNAVPKGNVLELAKFAAVQAAKNTSQIIPYCHQLPVDFVGVEFQLLKDAIEITVQVKAIYKTGVEMEALTAASVAALTIYDMLKPFDEFMQIESIILLSKSGGKSDYKSNELQQIRSAVVVMSDSIAMGKNEDKSGKLIVDRLKSEGLTVEEYLVISDDEDNIVNTIKKLSDLDKLDLIVTTGGTGLGGRDRTPEALVQLIEKDIPGIAETMRNFGQERNSFSMLSRSQAGLRNKTLILSLPGSVGGATDSLNAVFPAVIHTLKIVAGEGHNNKELCKK